jgi:hypothetical protein
MRRDAFVAKGLRIETWRDFDGRCYVCWRPDVSIYCRTRKEVLKFAAWPTKTPTGDSLRAWLDSLEQMDAERKGVTAEPVGDANVEGSFDPLAHDVDNENTKMVV